MADEDRMPLPGAVRAGRPASARIQHRRQAAPEVQSEQELSPSRPQLREGATTERLVRRRTRAEDKFYVPPRIIPLGWSYEWKRKSCYGQLDTDHQTNLRENYWEPVPASRHPEMMPLNHPGAIEKDGMVLMERPQYLTDDARAEDYAFARGELDKATAQAGKQTPGGTFTRNHPSVDRIARVRHSYGPVDAEQ